MKAALCKALTGPESIVVEEVPAPEPGPGSVIVDVAAAALNFMDTLITRGKYQVKPQLPFAPSGEIAGHVVWLGEGVRDVAIGARVAAYIGHGGAAQQVEVQADRLIPVPAAVPLQVAASVCITYGTAMHGLAERAQLRAGETLAILGASGGAGLAAIEIGKLIGARVIAVASAEKLPACREAGADDLVDYGRGDLKQALRDLTGGRGVDVVYDCVGGGYAEPALRALTWRGRYMVVGFAAGDIPRMPLNLLLLKELDVKGVLWGEAVARDVAAHQRQMGLVFSAIAEGRLKPLIQAVMPLEQTADALRLLDARAVTGKLVIQM